MCCSLNIAFFNHGIFNCGIHSEYILRWEHIFCQRLDWSSSYTARFYMKETRPYSIFFFQRRFLLAASFTSCSLLDFPKRDKGNDIRSARDMKQQRAKQLTCNTKLHSKLRKKLVSMKMSPNCINSLINSHLHADIFPLSVHK